MLEIPENIYEDILDFVQLRFVNILEVNIVKYEDKINKQLLENLLSFKIQNNMLNIKTKSNFNVFKYNKSDFKNFKYLNLIKIDDVSIKVNILLSDDNLSANTEINDLNDFVINFFIPKTGIKRIVFKTDIPLFNDINFKLKQFTSHEIIHILQKITDTSKINKDETHVFMPHEFYPRLKDSIMRFYDQIGEIDESDTLEFIKHFIGYYGITKLTDLNFKSAIENKTTQKHEEIYKNMVTKFIKAISKDQDINIDKFL